MAHFLNIMTFILLLSACQSGDKKAIKNYPAVSISDRVYKMHLNKFEVLDSIVMIDGNAYEGMIEAEVGGVIVHKGTYKDGLRHGIHSSYFETGVLKEMCEYYRGVKHGSYSHYYPFAVQKTSVIANYQDGKRHGLYQEIYHNGKVQIERYYDNGTEISNRSFSYQGKVVSNYVVKEGRKYGLIHSSFCKSGLIDIPQAIKHDDN